MNFLVVVIHYFKEDKENLATHLLDTFAFPEHEELASHRTRDTAALVTQAVQNFNLDLNDCIVYRTDTIYALPCAVVKELQLEWMPCHGHML